MPDVFQYVHSARNGRSITVIVVILILVGLGYQTINLHPVIAGGVVLLCLPALYELGQNKIYKLTLDAKTLRWHVGPQTESVQLDLIDHVVVTTRLDFSCRVTLHLKTGEKLRLHPGVTPKTEQIVQALEHHQITVKRRHFTFVS